VGGVEKGNTKERGEKVKEDPIRGSRNPSVQVFSVGSDPDGMDQNMETSLMNQRKGRGGGKKETF